MNLSLVQDLSNINGQTCEQRNIEWVNTFYLACFSSVEAICVSLLVLPLNIKSNISRIIWYFC